MTSASQVLATLIRPGWESAEMVIPILHKCLAALLAVLIYVAQWSPSAVRIHLYIMCILTLCLWGCITLFVYEYRKMRAEGDKQGDKEKEQEGEGDKLIQDGVTKPAKAEKEEEEVVEPQVPAQQEYTD